jgi:copper resistance protein B
MLAGMMTQVVVAKAAPGTGHSFHAMDHGGHADHGRTTHEIGAPKAVTHALKEHGGGIFHAFRLEAGLGQGDGEKRTEWDFDGWIGGDEHKLWLKSEGERTAGETEQAEAWLLYSRKIATFWDLQVGARQDFQPISTTYLVLGFDGLAPFSLETEAHLFLSDEGDLNARLRLEKDVLLSRRLIAQPYLEGELYAQDVGEKNIGAGLADLEIGLQTRYEFSKRFAPYLDLRYERKLGETAAIAGNQGEDRDAGVVMVGVKVLF